MFVNLPHIGTLIFSGQGATESPMIIQWEMPSHPAAGVVAADTNNDGPPDLTGIII